MSLQDFISPANMGAIKLVSPQRILLIERRLRFLFENVVQRSGFKGSRLKEFCQLY